MSVSSPNRAAAWHVLRPLLDYALPPRCPACGDIVSDPQAFCAACWATIEFMGEPQCHCCGVELPSGAAGEGALCGACLAEPPPFERARAVMRYGEVGRTLAHRLKYGRRVSLARVMAMQMRRLLDLSAEGEASLLVPVPLHRWRIWSRGFNQAALIGRHLAKMSGIPLDTGVLRRTIHTPPLHSLGPKKRVQTVKSAFALAPGARERIGGRTVILIDDIWTTGATAAACAHMLKRGGARRVEILCWTRTGRTGD